MGTLPTRQCIVCGRRIKRITDRVYVYPTDGSRTQVYAWIMSDVEISADISTREECHRHTNAPFVLSHRTDNAGRIVEFTTWDGESFVSDFFCTDRCAMKQGYASAYNGQRYNWEAAQ